MTVTLTTMEAADLLDCTRSTALARLRARGAIAERRGSSFLWLRSDVDALVEERRLLAAEEALSPTASAWMAKGGHDVPAAPPDHDIVAERWGQPLDAFKLNAHRTAIEARKQNSNAVVDLSTIASLAGSTNGPRRSKAMRDAADDERRWRAEHPPAPRAFRLPKGNAVSWRSEAYGTVVSNLFVSGVDSLREKILRDAGCRFRLSRDLVEWARSEYFARMRREVYADDDRTTS